MRIMTLFTMVQEMILFYARKGDDLIYGEQGADTYVFKPSSGNDMLAYLNVKNDSLSLTDYSFMNIDDVFNKFVYIATEAVLYMNDNNSITMPEIRQINILKLEIMI